MRTSSYNIYITLPEDDAHLIIQGYTGAVDSINDHTYQYLKNGPAGEGTISPSTVEVLASRGYLTEKSFEEEREHLKRIAEIFQRQYLNTASFMIAPTFSCQLRCPYCYEAPISHRDNSQHLTMTEEQIKLAYSAIEEILDSLKKSPPRSITLYGGEPLVAENYNLVKKIVEEGMRRGFCFRAVTNGYDLVAYRDLLGEGRIDHLQITLDGFEEVHDRRRFTKEGLPTFERICKGVQISLDQGCSVTVRTNVDRSNLESLLDLNRFYIEQKWDKRSNFHPYACITKDWLKSEQLSPLDFLRASEEIFNKCPDEKIIITSLGMDRCFDVLLGPGNVPCLRPHYCAPNIGNYIFGPDGCIYSCWEEVGLDQGKIGMYSPKLAWNERLAKGWLNRYIANMPECLNCPYALICGGGCAKQARKLTGEMLSAHCNQFQETFQHVAPLVYRDRLKIATEQCAKTGCREDETRLCI